MEYKFTFLCFLREWQINGNNNCSLTSLYGNCFFFVYFNCFFLKIYHSSKGFFHWQASLPCITRVFQFLNLHSQTLVNPDRSRGRVLEGLPDEAAAGGLDVLPLLHRLPPRGIRAAPAAACGRRRVWHLRPPEVFGFHNHHHLQLIGHCRAKDFLTFFISLYLFRFYSGKVVSYEKWIFM